MVHTLKCFFWNVKAKCKLSAYKVNRILCFACNRKRVKHWSNSTDFVYCIYSCNALRHIRCANNNSVALSDTVCQHTCGAKVNHFFSLRPSDCVVVIIKTRLVCMLSGRIRKFFIHCFFDIISCCIFYHIILQAIQIMNTMYRCVHYWLITPIITNNIK